MLLWIMEGNLTKVTGSTEGSFSGRFICSQTHNESAANVWLGDGPAATMFCKLNQSNSGATRRRKKIQIKNLYTFLSFLTTTTFPRVIDHVFMGGAVEVENNTNTTHLSWVCQLMRQPLT